MLQTQYYCASEDGEHFNTFGESDSIFESLCFFYDAVNHPEDNDLELEFGIIIIDDDNQIEDYEPLSGATCDKE